MKKMIAILLMALFAIGLLSTGIACAEPVFTSPEEVNMEELNRILLPDNLIPGNGGVQINMTWLDLEGGPSVFYERFCRMDGILHMNEYSVYHDEYYGDFVTNIYLSSDPEDPYIYFDNDGAATIQQKLPEVISMLFEDVKYDQTDLTVSGAEEDGLFRITVIREENPEELTDIYLLDPESGRVLSVDSRMLTESGDLMHIMYDYEYSEEMTPDLSPVDLYQEKLELLNAPMSFATTDVNGNTFTEQDFSGAKLIMMNFWEPWCGPCVGEMPDLNELYLKYKDQGFVILGMCSDYNALEDIQEAISSTGVTYPILYSVESLTRYQTDYVPTTVFFDGNGNLLTDSPYIGANNREVWDDIISQLLNP